MGYKQEELLTQEGNPVHARACYSSPQHTNLISQSWYGGPSKADIAGCCRERSVTGDKIGSGVFFLSSCDVFVNVW